MRLLKLMFSGWVCFDKEEFYAIIQLVIRADCLLKYIILNFSELIVFKICFLSEGCVMF